MSREVLLQAEEQKLGTYEVGRLHPVKDKNLPAPPQGILDCQEEYVF